MIGKMKSPNKICPCLNKNHVGETVTGVRFGEDSVITSVNKRVVDLCVHCPFWDEETLVGECIFDKKGADCSYNSNRQNKNLVAD